MKIDDIIVGDVVVLNSGGPEMVVKKIKNKYGIIIENGVSVDCEPVIYCEWFIKDEIINGYEFAPETVSLVRRES